MVSTLDDYALVRDLVSDVISQGIDAAAAPIGRETDLRYVKSRRGQQLPDDPTADLHCPIGSNSPLPPTSPTLRDRPRDRIAAHKLTDSSDTFSLDSVLRD